MNQHKYVTQVIWTGNKGTGTDHYTKYDRSHIIKIVNKITIEGSSDTAFRGDYTKHNPEDLFLSSISVCHMLWYLHLCADAGVIVTGYEDNAEGLMEEAPKQAGKFVSVTLKMTVTVKDANMIDKAIALHNEANKYCFIANSLNFKVNHVCNVIVE
jgi:organic hydroperoxide reductase OsmC/OhrA